LVFVLLPNLAQATQIVPCSGTDCDLNSFIQGIANVITFMVTIAVPLSSAMFGFAGVLYFTARGNQSQIDKAHSIFTNVFIGLFIVLSAWLAVQLVVSSLLKENSGIEIFLKKK
jgi:hypothetical protein